MIVDVVAVDVDPTIWQAYCEECDKYVSEPLEDPKKAQKVGLVHAASIHVGQVSPQV